jgi:L-iditol 2-dehydrogenase
MREVGVRAAVLVETGKIDIRQVDRRSLGPDDVLIKTAYAGVCGSDLHAFRGKHPFRKPPVVLGHELAGTVIECGQGVRVVRPGDRVTVMPLVPCGACRLCRMGRTNLCLRRQVPGVGEWLGAFAEYFVAKASITFKVGETTPCDIAVLAEPLAVGIHGVFRQGRVQRGDRVIVLGAGPIGILTAMAARAAGAEEIVITDLLGFNLALAKEVCGVVAYDAGEPDWEAALARAHPDKFDIAFLCSGAPVTIQQAFACTRRGGRVIVTGMFLDPVTVDLLSVNLNELELIGSVVYDHADFRMAVEWIDTGRFDFRKLVTHTFPLDHAQRALTLLAERTDDALKVLLTM